MKRFYLFSLVLVAGLTLVACYQNAEPTIDTDATIEAAVEATLTAQPTNTPPDTAATVQAAIEATQAAQNTTDIASASDRPYRTYPEPTGQPGFRRYYQKRCYPGCHVPPATGTATPQPAHP